MSSARTAAAAASPSWPRAARWSSERSNGLVRLAYVYQHCEDFPDPRLLTTAASLTLIPAYSKQQPYT
jgi:hypothetical protein